MEKTIVAVCYTLLFIACVNAVVPGGISDIPNLSENEGASAALAHAVRQRNSKNAYLEVVSEVLSARSQVVAGKLYYFTVLMTRTNCTVDSVNETCTIPQENTQTYKCDFRVWLRPWLDSTIVTENCEN